MAYPPFSNTSSVLCLSHIPAASHSPGAVQAKHTVSSEKLGIDAAKECSLASSGPALLRGQGILPPLISPPRDAGDAKAGFRRWAEQGCQGPPPPAALPTDPPGPTAYLQPGTGSRVRALPAEWGTLEEKKVEEGFPQPQGVWPSSAELDKSGIKTTGEIQGRLRGA